MNIIIENLLDAFHDYDCWYRLREDLLELYYWLVIILSCKGYMFP